MPNWCQNLLVISGSEADVQKFELANYKDAQTLTFSAAVPMPESKQDDWYNWNCEHWGTKWDATDVKINRDQEQGWLKDEDDVHLSYRFSTAWSDPDQWFERMAPQWPDLKFLLNYVELGCDFSGQHYKEKGSTITSASETLSLSDIIASEFAVMF
jgi:hypothetical protein